MGEIVYMEKPDWISFEDIHNVLYEAHTYNRENGFNVLTATMSPEELENEIGECGKCYVALDGDKIVGTSSYRIIERNNWYVKGLVADRILIGIIPSFQGKGIYTSLKNIITKDINEHGIKNIEIMTAERNSRIRKDSEKDGYRYVNFQSPKSDHYNVILMKWLDGCTIPKWMTFSYYTLKRIYLKLRFKPGHVKRFGI